MSVYLNPINPDTLLAYYYPVTMRLIGGGAGDSNDVTLPPPLCAVVAAAVPAAAEDQLLQQRHHWPAARPPARHITHQVRSLLWLGFSAATVACLLEFDSRLDLNAHRCDTCVTLVSVGGAGGSSRDRTI